MSPPATVLLLLKRVDCVDGVASYLELLVTGLHERGDRVVIISGAVSTPDSSEMRRSAIAAAAIDWVVLPDLTGGWTKYSHLRLILSAIQKYQVDVVSPQGFSMLPLGFMVARLSGRPIVTNYHPSIAGRRSPKNNNELSFNQRLAFRIVTAIFSSDKYIAMSSEIADFFRRECHIPSGRIHQQLLGVETDFYRNPADEERKQARARFGLEESMLVAVLPGRMSSNKGHDIVAAACRMLQARRPELAIVCLFPGGGDQRDLIEANVLRNEDDRDKFRFLGFVDPLTLRECYWAADIVLLPSRREGFGIVVAEAMCCGAIVIRTPSGGCRDQVVEGKTGYVVPFEDPAALAEAIEKVADSPYRVAMRQEAMQVASTKFAKSKMLEGTSELYRSLARVRKQGQRRAVSTDREPVDH